MCQVPEDGGIGWIQQYLTRLHLDDGVNDCDDMVMANAHNIYYAQAQI